jgi:acyl-coenzyme A thioesterase PaaI-like protein
MAAASSVAFMAAISNYSSNTGVNDDRCERKGGANTNKIPTWRRQCINTLNSFTYNKINEAAKCESARKHTSSVVHESSNTINQERMDYYYLKINPDEMFEASTLDSHAVFGPLFGANLIERFNVYTRVYTNDTALLQPKERPDRTNEIAVVDLKLGTRLNGHDQIVHGGIISLLVDTSLGFGYHALLQEDKDKIAVTANLKVNFRAPFREGSEAVIRVFLDKLEGRKMFFSAVLESHDGSVLYAEATSLFIKVGRGKVVQNR